MKRTINGITYDTNKAEEIAQTEMRPSQQKHADDYTTTVLYHGDDLYFLVEENPRTGIPKIVPLDKDTALYWYNVNIEK